MSGAAAAAARTRRLAGDWQTPPELARAALAAVRRLGVAPHSFVEPTCGSGAFLAAAAEVFPRARRFGFEVDPAHLAEAARGPKADLRCADFFTVDWRAELGRLQDPVLVAGNPPWVTSCTVGALGGRAVPGKRNVGKRRGIEAMTGAGNFDVAERMLHELLAALQGRRFALAMLCKATTARRLLELAAHDSWPLQAATFAIDAARHFAAAVDAVLLVAQPAAPGSGVSWHTFASLDATAPQATAAIVDGRAVGDAAAAAATAHLAGPSRWVWRSGLKHDCAKVFELRRDGAVWVNGLGEPADVEPAQVWPLLKGSDVAHGAPPRRGVIVPQRRLGDDPARLQHEAPATWRYLQRHAARLARRKSAVYRGRPPFSIFGVGDYAFAPHKVAICGLYKRLHFQVVAPHHGRPTLVDDTCYFLACADAAQAAHLAAVLNGRRAESFFAARVFWDAKRPITRGLLQALSLERLLEDGDD